MASGSQLMTTYYAKRIVGDASAAQADKALLQTGTNVNVDTWILARTNRSNSYGIKYVYDTTTTTIHDDENDEDITTNNGQDKIEFYGGSATASAWVQLDTGDILVNNIDSHGNINLYFADGIGIGLTNNGHIESTQANDYRKGVYFTDTNGNIVSWHESYIMENRTNTMFESANLVNDTLVYGGMQIQIRNSGESYISLLMTHASSNGSSRMIDMCHYTDNTNEILLNADTKPRTTNVYNLGSASRIWKDAYIYNLNIGTKEVTTAPTELTASNRIIITPYYHTGGPWYIKSMDDNTNAYLALYYGTSELLQIKHEGTFQANIKANITGNAATATALTSNAGGTEQPIYFTGGKPAATSYALKATVNNSTSGYMAYYSGDRAISGISNIRATSAGSLSIFPSGGSYRDGIRIHARTTDNTWAAILLCGADNTGDSGTSANSWFIGNTGGDLYLGRNGTGGSGTFLRCVNNVWSWNGTATGNISGNAGSANRLVSRGNVTCETGGTKPAVSGLSMSQVYNNGYPTTYGNVITMYGGGAGQLLIGWSGSATTSAGARANAYLRSQRDTAGTLWSDWYTILDSGNYNDYAPTKTGGGASGTWGISITGNAATVSRATFGDSGNGEHNANNIASNGLYYYTSNGPSKDGANQFTTTDGAIYCQAYSTTWVGQIAQDYRNGALAVRGKNNGTWSTWYSIPKMIVENYPALLPPNNINNWIKIGTANNSYGLLPSQSGGAGSGHNYLGTSSWYWKYAYIDEIYGHLNGNCTGSSASCTGNAATATKATQDGSGNTITSKYVTVDTAQTITGTKSWGTSGAGGQLNGAATNGGINSIRVGDDVWLGDCNAGGIMGMKSTGANTGFYFYNSSSTQTGQLYADGTYIVINKGLRIASTTGIYYTGSKATYRMIRFIDNASDTYGNGISIGGGGQAIIGGGESSDTAAAQAGTAGSEIMWICNDGAIEFYPNLQSGWTTSYKNYINTSGHFYSVAVHSAIWNDYAECRKSDFNEAGYVITPSSNGISQKTTSRLQPGCRVISDTWGHILGESLEAKTPVAVSGRVLVYPYQDITNYSIGDCVCSAPDGKVDIMTREEIKEWPDRIIGIVNEIPTYDEWIQTNPDNEEETIKIKVKGRIWIDVR